MNSPHKLDTILQHLASFFFTNDRTQQTTFNIIYGGYDKCYKMTIFYCVSVPFALRLLIFLPALLIISPPPEGNQLIFGGGTKLSPPFPPQISYDTFCKETYQRGPSQLTAMSPHSLFPNQASRRWEYSHLARSLQCFADQNLLGSHNTLTGGCSILIRKSL